MAHGGQKPAFGLIGFPRLTRQPLGFIGGGHQSHIGVLSAFFCLAQSFFSLLALANITDDLKKKLLPLKFDHGSADFHRDGTLPMLAENCRFHHSTACFGLSKELSHPLR